MIVVVEGPNGSGKSTMCRAVKFVAEIRGHETTYEHFGTPKGNPWPQYVSVVRGASMYPGVVIIDRLHYGELVYPETYGRYSDVTPRDVHWLDGQIHDGIGRTVILCPSAQTMHDRIQRRGENATFGEIWTERDAFIRHGQAGQRANPRAVSLQIEELNLAQAVELAEDMIISMERQKEVGLRWR